MKTKITFFIAALFGAVLFFDGNVFAQNVDSNALLHVKFEGDLVAATNSGSVTLSRASSTDPTFTTGPTSFGQALNAADNAPANQITSTTDLFIAGSGARTLAAWIKGTETTEKTIMSMGVNAPQSRFTMKLLGGTLRAEINGGGINSDAISGFNIGDNQWHHLAIVYPGGGAALTDVVFYVDGTFIPHSSVVTSVPNTTAAPFQVGHRAGSEHYTGSIDDIRVYSFAATADQISTIYGGGTLGTSDIGFGRNELKVFPTIVTDYLNIESILSEAFETTVFNMLGKTVQKTTATAQLNLSGLSSGIYILKIRSGNKVANYKILKN